MNDRALQIALAVDVVAVGILAFGIYFPRHQRRDLLAAFVAANVGLFAVAAFVVDREINVAIGLGLFALLSVIRLRSSAIAQEDIGYDFIALVLGLINGFAVAGDLERAITLDVILLLVIFIVDHPRVLAGRRYQEVTLDAVYHDEDKLRSDLEHQLGGTVTKLLVRRVDFVHGHTLVDVAFRSDPAARKRHANR